MESKKKYPFCSSVHQTCPVSDLRRCEESLGDTEMEILKRIYRNRKITVDEIYNLGGISKSGILHRIETLQSKGILKEKDPFDNTEWVIAKTCCGLLEKYAKDKAETCF